MQKFRIYLLTLSMLILSACGFVNDKPVEGASIYRSPELSKGCEIDPSKISQIFVDNIKDQIKCIEEKLSQFKYVESQNRDVLTEGELTKFVRKFFKKNTDTIIHGLSLIFELNMVLLRDEAGQISRSNITPLFTLLSKVNEEAVIIANAVKDMMNEEKKDQFWENREKLNQAITRFSTDSLKIISLKQNSKNINIQQFIIDLQNKLSNREIDEKFVNSLLFIKKVFLGGSRDILTSDEIITLVNKAPRVLNAAFDIALTSRENFKTRSEYTNFIIDSMDAIESNIVNTNSEEVAFTLDDLINIAEQIQIDDFTVDGKDDFKLKDYEKVLESFKKDLIGGHARNFKFKDIKTIFTYLRASMKVYEDYDAFKILTKKLENEDLETIKNRKEDVYKLASLFEKSVKSLIRDNSSLPEKTYPLKFIETLNNETKTFNFDMEVVNSLFSLKQISLGGTRDTVTRDEILNAFSKVKEIVEIYFDLKYLSPKIKEENKDEYSKLLITQLNKIENLTIDSSSDFDILSLEEAYKMVESLIEDKEQQKDSKTFITAFKSHILRGSATQFTLKEFKTSIDMLELLIHVGDYANFAMDFFKENDKEERLAKKYLFNTETSIFAKKIKSTLDKGRLLERPVDMVSFVDGIKGMKSLEEMDLELLRDVLPVKSLFFGGNTSELTKENIKQFINKATSLSDLAIDLSTVEFSNYKTSNDALMAVYKFIKRFNLLFANISKDTEIIKVSALLKLADFAVKDVNVKNFKRTIIDIKERVLEQRSRDELSYDSKDPELPANNDEIDSIFSKREIDGLISLTYEAIETIVFTNVTYDFFIKQLELDNVNTNSSTSYIKFENKNERSKIRDIRFQNLPRSNFLTKEHIEKFKSNFNENKNSSRNKIKRVRFPDLPIYNTFRKEYLGVLKENFEKIAVQYKFFREKDSGLQYYTFDIKRNKYGFTELALIRWGLGKVLVGYGPEAKTEHSGSIDMDQLSDFLVGIRSVLDEFGLWTSNFKFFSRNILLLGDLFQNQSNGDMRLNQEEGTEFVALFLQAVVLATDVHKKMQTLCPVVEKGDGDFRIDAQCHRENFFNVMFNDLDTKKFFPQLHKYASENTQEDNIQFIYSIEGFARDIPVDEPLRLRDYSLLIGAMLNIESTFLRFDLDRDNLIGKEELERAFLVYRNVIIMLAQLDEDTEKYARTVFFYMVKNMEVPCSKAKLYAQHKLFWVYFRNTEAKRINIGTLLYYLVHGAGCPADAE